MFKTIYTQKINVNGSTYTVLKLSQKWQHKKAQAGRKSARDLKEFVIFKPLSCYYFKETIGFDVKVSLVSHPVSHPMRWQNKPGDITKEFWEKANQFHGTFHGLKITNCKHLCILLENSAKGLRSRRECCWGYASMIIHPKSYHIFPIKVVATLLSVAAEGYQIILNWLWFKHNCWKYICKTKFNSRFLTKVQNIIRHSSNDTSTYFNKVFLNNFKISKAL